MSVTRWMVPVALVAALAWSLGARADTPVADGADWKLEIASPDGAYRARLGLTAQLWLFAAERDVLTADPGHELKLQFRRIRPTLSGNIFTPNFRYMLHVSLTPGNWEFMDLFGDYAFKPGVRLRFGQWKIPFSRYRIRSYKNRQVVDWTLVSSWFGGERQIGLALHDGYDDKTPPPFEWAVGVFNGINSRSAHAQGPSKLVDDVQESELLHPEIVARVGYNHGGIDTSGESDLEGGPARFAVSLSGAWDTMPVRGQDFAVRGAVDGLLKVGGFSVSGTFYIATLPDGPSPFSMRPGALGAFAGAGYVIGKRVEIAGNYAAVIPMTGMAPFHEARGGVNVFILGRRVQWRTDGGALISGGGDDVDVEVRTIIQMSI